LRQLQEVAGVNEEAEAFDKITRERVRHGFVPDLRKAGPCDWFYNNPWRRPHLTDKVFGRYFRFARTHASGGTLLEVGSGTGYLSLEMARSGFHVTGIDLSEESVKAARQTAEKNEFREDFGSLEYVAADFIEWNPPRRYDNVCFIGALHHFENPESVLDKVKGLLETDGRVIVVEPAREWVTGKDAAIIALIRLLLSMTGAWYEDLAVPSEMGELENYVRECLVEYGKARDTGGSGQSPHDNACKGGDILAALKSRFTEIACESGTAFFNRLGGGVRARDEESARRLADFLHIFDCYAIKSGLMNPTGFLWAGKKHGSET
jgi:2-polyprenyl-6-hydroxyphenyl methylase/3-demethylubiquinone-9 3-methyltransferase